MRSDAVGVKVWSDPAGLCIEPGQAVRRILVENIHTTTAYPPRNGHAFPAAGIPE